MLRVTANPETCAVSSLCVYRLPAVFDQDEDGLVVVLDETPEGRLHEEVRRAGGPRLSDEVHPRHRGVTPGPVPAPASPRAPGPAAPRRADGHGPAASG
ncbi:(4Fe-4S)-binding protein [Streptomyces sp. GKU 257-1]|nr:(4Fe-4S)-binding protein [Streptomyces sp. GKU 257-1]